MPGESLDMSLWDSSDKLGEELKKVASIAEKNLQKFKSVKNEILEATIKKIPNYNSSKFSGQFGCGAIVKRYLHKEQELLKEYQLGTEKYYELGNDQRKLSKEIKETTNRVQQLDTLLLKMKQKELCAQEKYAKENAALEVGIEKYKTALQMDIKVIEQEKSTIKLLVEYLDIKVALKVTLCLETNTILDFDAGNLLNEEFERLNELKGNPRAFIRAFKSFRQ